MALPQGMKRCGKNRRCPICLDNRRKGDSHCLYIEFVRATETEGFLCEKSGGGQDAAGGWKALTVRDELTGVESLKPTASGGHIYVPADAKKVGDKDFHAVAPSPERQAQIERERLAGERYAAEARAGQVKSANKAWAAAGSAEVEGTGPAYLDGKGPHHRRAAEYFERRGIKLADLPGGVVPRAIRYHGATSFWPENAAGRRVEVKGPALISSCVDAAGKVSAVQRTVLDPSGLPAKAESLEGWPDGGDDFAKKSTLGSKSVGVATRLTRDVGDDGVLILAEGLETALACLAATGCHTWSVVDTSGLKNLNLPAEMIDRERGKLKTVIIAADCDRWRVVRGKPSEGPGQKAARLCAEKLGKLHPHLVVKIATPSAEVAPSCFDADGQPNGKGIDWLDVYNVVGKDVVRRCLLEEADEVTAGDGGNAANAIPPGDDPDEQPGFGGDEGRGYRMIGGVGPLMPAGELSMARQLLVDWPDFAPPKEERANQRWLICRFREKWYRYVKSDRPRWVQTADELLVGHVHTRLQFYTKEKKGQLVAFAPPLKTARSVLGSMVSDCGPAIESEPAWLPATFDEKGTAKWSEGIVEVPRGAEKLIPCANGILNVTWIGAKKVKLFKHTPRLFSLSCRPFAVDVKLLQALLDGDEPARDRIAEKHFPATMRWLRHASSGCKLWMERFWRWAGLNLTSDISFQKMAIFIGLPGCGKSLGTWILTQLVGEGGWASTTLGRMVSQFGCAGLLGKTCAIIGDMSTGKFVDVGQAKEVILNITGDDAVSIEFKGKDAYPAVLGVHITAAMNQMTKMQDESGALHRRFLPFQFGPPLGAAADTGMKKAIEGEMAAVFCAALAGLGRLYAARLNKEECWPLTSQETQLLDDIREENEPLFAYKEARLEEGPKYEADRDEVYTDYVEWFNKTQGTTHQPLTRAWFGRKLRSMVFIYPEDGQPGSGNRSERAYKGIRLRVEESQGTLPRGNGAAVPAEREEEREVQFLLGSAPQYAQDARPRPSHPSQHDEIPI